MTVDSQYMGLRQDNTKPESLTGASPIIKFLSQFTVPVFLLNSDAQFLYANDAACDLIKLSHQELFGLSLQDFDSSASSNWFNQWRSLKQQRSLVQTVQWQTPDDRQIPVKLTMDYLEYEGQEFICIFINNSTTSTAQNLKADSTNAIAQSHQILSVESLQASLALMQATLESTAIGILSIGSENNVLYYNTTFAKLWRLPEVVALSKNCNRAKTFFENQVKDPEVFRRVIWEVSTQSNCESFDVLELKDGRTFAHYAKPQWLDGKIIGRVWSVWDITKVQQVEAARRRDEAELRIQQELEQSRQLGELKARFIASVCHQFRSLLNIISVSNSLLKRHVDRWTTEQKQPYLEHIQVAVDQLTELLDEILLFGKSGVGKLNLQPKAVDLELFCQNIIEQMRPLSENNHHTIVFTSQTQGAIVNLDPNLLQPILTNLLANAIKYSPVGSTTNFILSYRKSGITFQIQDEGIGISTNDQKRLFEPFFRGGNVGEIEGSGLGLATVKNLVELHHGQISVSSEVGVGTTVTIVLPVT